MMGKVRRQQMHVSMTGKARRRKGAQSALFGRLGGVF